MPTSPMRVNLSPLFLYFGFFHMAAVSSTPLTPSTVHETSEATLASTDGSTFSMEQRSVNLSSVAVLSSILLPKTSANPVDVTKDTILDLLDNGEVDPDVLAALNGQIVERLMTEATCLANCTSALYRCMAIQHGANPVKYVCEMDAFMLGLVVISALFTGICVPIACITFYVCGFYARLRRCLTASKPFYSRADNETEAYEKCAETTCPSMQSTTALISTRTQPIYVERMYKKKHSTIHRCSQPQVELPRERAKSLCGSSVM